MFPAQTAPNPQAKTSKNNPMKNKSNHKLLAAGFLTLALTAGGACAATYTWDGSESGDWGTAGNWAGNAAPPTGNVAVNHVVNFYQAGAGNLDTYLGAGARNIATLNFTADADSNVNIRMDNNSTTARSINLNSSSGTNTISVESGAAGDFRIWSPVSGGRINMTGNLVVDHNGSGLLTVEKINNTAGATVTKTGSGTLKIATSSSYMYNGATAVNGGTLLVDSGASIDLVNSFSGGITVGGASASGTPTLGGVGYIAGSTTIAAAGGGAAGTLAPGFSVGAMTFLNTLTLAGSALMEIDGTAGAGVTGGHDFVNLTGAGAAGLLSYGGTMTLDIGTILGVGSYSWNLFDFASKTGGFTGITLADQYSGSLSDAGGGVWGLTSGNDTWTFTESTGVLGLTVIPEPRAALLGGLGLLMLLRRRR